MYIIRKAFTFEASHQLKFHDGKCARLHGHSWRAVIELRGAHLLDRGPKSGMLFDYGSVAETVKPIVEEFLDHHHLNDTLALESPTSERIAHWLYQKLAPKLELLWAVEIDETCTSSCRYQQFCAEGDYPSLLR